MKEIIKVKKTKKGNIVKAHCRKCKSETNHEIVNDYNLSGSVPIGHEQTIDWDTEYQIISCQGCESISFRKTATNSEEVCQISEDEYEYPIHIDIYPDPIEGRTPLDESYLFPTKLQQIYLETMKLINSKQPILTGIGIRAIVETICKDKNTAGRGLFDKINNLVTQGVLTDDGAKILHKLRTMGNNAAHEVKPHTEDQLKLAMDVVDHLLQGVYILPERAKDDFK